ncbi:hypothetical protein J8F10_14335 [Gemmata sp. G18]|uniref:Uncharacterized protein n=1 Tax=Gemmata palustris TaxID=2822762 RepID=A0ABS5BRU8_9BACT|nr:hypothetical protein [Gemmata palustris]MBP3956455.1 hypothetical protein [Gemmata palustris]
MSPNDEQPARILFQLWFKPIEKAAKWRKVGEPCSHAEAIHRIQGNGSFWLAELRNPKLAQPSLFV